MDEPALHVQAGSGTGDPRLGQGSGRHEGRRPTRADHPAQPRLRGPVPGPRHRRRATRSSSSSTCSRSAEPLSSGGGHRAHRGAPPTKVDGWPWSSLATDPAAAVPTCPEWTVRDLVRHLGGVHRWATGHVAGGRTEVWAVGLDEVVGAWPDDAALAGWLRRRVHGAGRRVGRRARRPRVLELPPGSLAAGHVGPPAGPRDGRAPHRRRDGRTHCTHCTDRTDRIRPVRGHLRRRRGRRAARRLRAAAFHRPARRRARQLLGPLHRRRRGLGAPHRARRRHDDVGYRLDQRAGPTRAGTRRGGRSLSGAVEPHRSRAPRRGGRPGVLGQFLQTVHVRWS